MQTILLTGATGFVGKAFCEYLLKRNCSVYVIVRDPEKLGHLLNDEHLHVRVSDLNNLELIDMDFPEIDVFYHIAWQGTSGKDLKEYKIQLKSVELSCNMAYLGAKLGVKKFVYIGTLNQLEIRYCLAHDDCMPRYSCIYSTAKLAAEMMCRTIAFQEKMRYNAATLASVYGPGDNSLTIQNILIKNLIKKKSPQLVKGEFLYDWVYIDEVVEMLWHIGLEGKDGKNYYVGHNNVLLFKDIVEQVRDILSPDLPLKFGVNEDISYIDFSLIDVNGVYDDFHYNNKIDFKESILKTAEWVKEMDKNVRGGG